LEEITGIKLGTTHHLHLCFLFGIRPLSKNNKEPAKTNAYSAENGRLSATKMAGCPGQIGHPITGSIGGRDGVASG
jgi:hypothetical protein